MTESQEIPTRFLDRWKEVNNAVVGFASVAKTLNKVDDIITRNTELEDQVAELGKELADQKDKIASLELTCGKELENFELRYDTWASERSRLERKFEELQDRSKELVDEGQRNLKSVTIKLRKAEEGITRRDSEIQGLERGLGSSQDELKAFKSAIGLLELDDSLSASRTI
ncbi:hypothetical protein K469DRAFT_783901 [Zopfia rhizophila CBS 207.26]|uniref:Uncharacterized protein n=1 Tax=Zopfia rhizophila CBS 207.26 TaxID=1314779 RepID=A0A6A6E2P0_9PEZI|nr:hypothetical protein K469DRAFT_783901 [Zopfia rhizophila CBS 207.26]